METSHPCLSTCRCCQFYQPVGHRGGNCEVLGVVVRAGWKSCHLGIPVFQNSSKLSLVEELLTSADSPQDKDKVKDISSNKVPVASVTSNQRNPSLVSAP